MRVWMVASAIILTLATTASVQAMQGTTSQASVLEGTVSPWFPFVVALGALIGVFAFRSWRA